MPKLYIAGDSLASIKLEDKRPESGWGEYLSFFISPKIEVVNLAINGRSTKSYIDEGLLSKIDHMIKKGDYLLISFGHNDEKIGDLSRYTNPDTDYQENLLRFARVAWKNEATPIFVTSISRRNFKDSKLVIDTVSSYPRSMKKCAKQHHIFCIDAYTISHQLIRDLGEEKSKLLFLHLDKNMHINYPSGIEDNTHLSPYGAKLIASLITVELNKII
jgi:lysophospholipase L1-like esterase